MKNLAKSYNSVQHSGIVIPTALLIAMVVLMTATALMGQTRQNLQFSGQKALETRRLFVAQGAVNEFIDHLNSDPNLLGHTEGSAYSGTWHNLTYHVWREQDSVDPSVHHIIAKVFPTGQEAEVTLCGVVVQAGPDLSGFVATNVPDLDINTPDPIFFSSSSSPSWSTLPPVQRIGWDGDGNEVLGNGDAGTLVFGGGNTSGQLFFVYAPGIDGGLVGDWSSLGNEGRSIGQTALEFLVGFSAGESNGSWLFTPNTLAALTSTAQLVVEPSGLGFWPGNRLLLSQHATVLRYDMATGWEQLPPMLNHEFDPTTASFLPEEKAWPDGTPAGPFHIYGLAGPMSCDDAFLYVPLYKEGPDMVARFDLATRQWSALPPVPDRSGQPTDISYVATTGREVYVQAWPFGHVKSPTNVLPLEPPRILRLNEAGTDWEELAEEVPSSQVVDGQLIESLGPAMNLGCMAAGNNGALYVSSRESQPNTIFKYAGGRWVPIAGPVSSGNNYAEALHADIGVDGAGTVMLRSPNETGPDEMYTIRPSSYSQLPSLPDGKVYSSQMIGGASRDSAATIYRPTATY